MFEVNSDKILKSTLQKYTGNTRSLLRAKRINYTNLTTSDEQIQVSIKPEDRIQALSVIKAHFPLASYSAEKRSTLIIELDAIEKQEIIDTGITRTIIRLKDRVVNRFAPSTPPLIQRVGKSNRLVIQLPPGYTPAAKDNITIDPRPPRFLIFLRDENLTENDEIPLSQRGFNLSKDITDDNSPSKIIVHRRPLISGEGVRRAGVVLKNNGTPEIHIQLGTGFWNKLDKLKDKTAALYLNEEVIATPTIKAPITNNTLILQGNFSIQKARRISDLIVMSSTTYPIETIRQWVTPPGFNNTAINGN